MPDLGDLGDGLSLGGYAVLLFYFLFFIYFSLCCFYCLVLVEGGGRPKESIKKIWKVAKGGYLPKLPNVSRVGSCLLLSDSVVQVVF